MQKNSNIHFTFRGLMVPVFTPFNSDEKRSVCYEIIPKYASYIKSKNIKAVLINGTTGEGPSLNIIERKKITELWQEACKSFNLTLMVQIGGASMNDVIELATHAELIKVDSVLCLPELYFKPKIEEDLVEYLHIIAKYCPSLPLLYYHIPAITDVNLNMPRFIKLAEEKIQNFSGIKYTSNDLDQGSACLKINRAIFLGADTLLAPALLLGFDSIILTSLNICPEISLRIVDCMKANKLEEAKILQQQLSQRVYKILEKGDWVTAMKYEFNQISNQFKIGPVRHPLKEV